jgi:hypothetical protein
MVENESIDSSIRRQSSDDDVELSTARIEAAAKWLMSNDITYENEPDSAMIVAREMISRADEATVKWWNDKKMKALKHG